MRFSLRKAAKLTFVVGVFFCANLFWKDIFPVEDKEVGQDGRPVARDMPSPENGRNFNPETGRDDLAMRYQRSAKSVQAENVKEVVKVNPVRPNGEKANVNKQNKFQSFVKETQMDDIFITVKTTLKNHKTRLRILLDTWISFAKSQTYIFTDAEDKDIAKELPEGHLINTNCSNAHNRQALCCKMAQEYDYFIDSKKRWFCHVDDDTYVNIPNLLALVRQYNHTADWYLGKPSLNHPIEVIDRIRPGQKIAFWFATGGAGFCISQALALKMLPYAGGGRLMTAGEQIRLPDDCTIGYIIDFLLHKELTVIDAFHSHLEALWHINVKDLKKQITFSYVRYGERDNRLQIPGFPESQDPTRFWSAHCHLNPTLLKCREMTR